MNGRKQVERMAHGIDTRESTDVGSAQIMCKFAGVTVEYRASPLNSRWVDFGQMNVIFYPIQIADYNAGIQ